MNLKKFILLFGFCSVLLPSLSFASQGFSSQTDFSSSASLGAGTYYVWIGYNFILNNDSFSVQLHGSGTFTAGLKKCTGGNRVLHHVTDRGNNAYYCNDIVNVKDAVSGNDLGNGLFQFDFTGVTVNTGDYLLIDINNNGAITLDGSNTTAPTMKGLNLVYGVPTQIDFLYFVAGSIPTLSNFHFIVPNSSTSTSAQFNSWVVHFDTDEKTFWLPYARVSATSTDTGQTYNYENFLADDGNPTSTRYYYLNVTDGSGALPKGQNYDVSYRVYFNGQSGSLLISSSTNFSISFDPTNQNQTSIGQTSSTASTSFPTSNLTGNFTFASSTCSGLDYFSGGLCAFGVFMLVPHNASLNYFNVTLSSMGDIFPFSIAKGFYSAVSASVIAPQDLTLTVPILPVLGSKNLTVLSSSTLSNLFGSSNKTLMLNAEKGIIWIFTGIKIFSIIL